MEAWAIRYDDMVKRGLTKKQWFTEYKNNNQRLTDYSWGAVEKYFGAFQRAVKKYGSLANAEKEYLKDTRRMYVEVRLFVSWCPAGQREKNAGKSDKVDIAKTAMKFSVADLEAMLAFRKKHLNKLGK